MNLTTAIKQARVLARRTGDEQEVTLNGLDVVIATARPDGSVELTPSGASRLWGPAAR